MMMMMTLMMMKIFAVAVVVVDVMTDNDVDDVLKMDAVDDDFDDVHVTDEQHLLALVNSSRYVETDEDLVVQVLISLA